MGYNSEQLREVFRIIDWMMILPERLNEKFERELIAVEESLNMPYITSVERIAEDRGEAKGEARGRSEGSAAVLLRQLARRHGPLSAALERRIRQLPFESLERLAEALFEFRSIEDLESWLRENGQGNLG